MRNGFCCKNNLLRVLLYRATFCMTWLCFHVGFFFFALTLKSRISSVQFYIQSWWCLSQLPENCISNSTLTSIHLFLLPLVSRTKTPHVTEPTVDHRAIPYLGYSSLQCTQQLPGIRQFCKIWPRCRKS